MDGMLPFRTSTNVASIAYGCNAAIYFVNAMLPYKSVAAMLLFSLCMQFYKLVCRGSVALLVFGCSAAT